jgi:hypothetical protein
MQMKKVIRDNPTVINKIMTNGTKTRRTEITIETHSITIIRTSGRQTSAHCEHCRKEVAAFAPEQIAAFLTLELAEVCRRIRAGELHLTRTERGGALVCGNSLGAAAQTKFLPE